jgi:hypothetical protein
LPLVCNRRAMARRSLAVVPFAPVPDDLREQLLASYADFGEAMVTQNLLEAEGIPCRVADLSGVPDSVLGIAGRFHRSYGLYVLDVDAERACTLLATLSATENALSDEALAAEAAASASPSQEYEERGRAPVRSQAHPARAARPLWGALLAAIAVIAALLVVRACR